MKTRLFICLLIFVFAFGIRNAKAQSSGYPCTWVGGTGYWDDDTKWNITGVGTGYSYPGNLFNNDPVVFSSGTSNVTIRYALPLGSIYSLTVNNGANVTINIASGLVLKATSSITVGSTTTTTLAIVGPGDVTGTSAITINPGATLSNSSTASITAASLTFAGSTGTLTNNGGCTLSGALAVNGTASVGGTSSLSAASLTETTSTTFTVNQNVSISGAASLTNSPTTSVGSGSTLAVAGNMSSNTNSAAITLTGAGSYTLGGYSYAYQGGLTIGSATLSPTVTLNTGTSLNESQNTTSFSNYGTLLFSSGCSWAIGNSPGPAAVNYGTITATGSTFNFSGNNTTMTNYGTINLNSSSTLNFTSTSGFLTNTYVSAAEPGAFNINSSSTLNINQNSFAVTNSNAGSSISVNSATLTFGSGAGGASLTNKGSITATSSALNFLAGSGNTISNTGSFMATTSPITCSSGGTVTITNSGSFSALSSSTIKMAGNNSYIKSTAGTLTITSSNITFTGQPCDIYNTGTSTTNISGSTISIAQSGYLENDSSNPFTVNGTSNVTFGYGAYLLNSGTFYAGTSNSPCVLNFTSQNGYLTNSGNFYLGSTSYLYPTGTSVNITSSAYFVLQSDQYGTAGIGALGTSASYTGLFYPQRFITGGSGYRSYRLMAVPATTTSGGTTLNLSYLNTSKTINGITYNGALTGGPSGTTNGFSVTNNNPTIYIYNDALASSSSTFVSGKTVGITKISGTTLSTLSGTTTGSTTLTAGNGFLLYFIGDNSSLVTANTRIPGNTTLTTQGYLAANNIIVSLWNTGSTSLYYNTSTLVGYNMVGNPYPSTLDLNQVYSDNSGSITKNFYELYNETPSQNYVVWNTAGASSSSANASEYVEPGQGFFVVAAGSSKTLTFKEDQKIYNTSLTTTSAPPLLLNAALPVTNSVKQPGTSSKAVVTKSPLTGLHMRFDADSITYDECGIYFDSASADTFNRNDAIDFDGVNPKVFLSSYTTDKVRTALNFVSGYTYGKRVKLFAKALSDGIYHLTLEDMINIDTTNFSVYLIDNKLNDSLDMVHYKTYNFNLTAADTSDFANRFVLVFERKPTAPYSLITFAGQKATGGIQLNWNTVNEGDFTSFGLQKLGTNGQYTSIDSVQSNSSGVYSFNDQNPIMGNNIYRLAQSDIHGKITFSSPININYNTILVSGMFTIYPNPSKDLINVSVNSGITSSKNTPTYLANIYDLSGVVMNTKQVNSNSWTQDITSYKAGVYILELKTAEGDIVGKAKFVKTN